MSNVQECSTKTCAQTMTAQPPADIYETEQGFRIAVDMPGVEQDKVNVRLEQRSLEVSGQFSPLAPQDTVERPFEALQFKRIFHLGEAIDTDNIDARVEQGVLTVELPKHAKAQPRRIQINAGN